MTKKMKNKIDSSLKFATKAIHAGQAPDPTTGAIMPAVYQTSTFVQSSPGVFKDDYDYARSANPTRTALEENIAALEGGKYGIAFSSGCAATDAILHQLSVGDHVIYGDDVYGGTFRLFDKVFKKQGLSFTAIDLTNTDNLNSAITENTKIIWLETPTNPMLKIADIEAICKIAQEKSLKKNIQVVVDNTFASPYLQNPLALGADIVMHSSTKYIGGHSDLIGGIAVTNQKDLADQLHYIQNAVGAVPAPWDCFLLLRSTKTLALRMQRHSSNAMEIAKFLEGRDDINWVRYPGLPSHPQYEIAKKQMKDFGGMITMEISGGLEKAKQFLEKVQIFTLAESLGGVESLVEHPAIMTHASIPAEQRASLGISDGLVRLSVGVEDCGDLIEDLEQALG